MKKYQSALWLALSIFLSAAGIVAFVFLFLPGWNIYWFILSPIIITLYQAPAAYVLYLWKKKKKESLAKKRPNPDGLKSEEGKENAPDGI